LCGDNDTEQRDGCDAEFAQGGSRV
jgi:hypothetical protein